MGRDWPRGWGGQKHWRRECLWGEAGGPQGKGPRACRGAGGRRAAPHPQDRAGRCRSCCCCLSACPALLFLLFLSVLQFGFITIFVAACPLAPLFALLNNWVEIHLDVQKFICDYRRPVAERAQGIGIWFSILEAIAHLAVTSNAFLIAFTSDFLPRMYYEYVHDSSLRGYVNFALAYAPWDFVLQSNTTCRYRAFRDRDGNLTLTYWQLLAVRLGFVIVFEHVVFFIGRVIAWLVPDIPESVEVKVKREQYLAKEALAENKVLLERQETRSKASIMDEAAGRDWETEQLASS